MKLKTVISIIFFKSSLLVFIFNTCFTILFEISNEIFYENLSMFLILQITW